MQSTDLISLRRPCEAVVIPAGTPVVLEAGMQVRLMQALGGSYTVLFDGGMARIDGKDADALGLEPVATPGPVSPAEGPPIEELVWDQMRTCYDPEIPINIVDLGLVYDCRISPSVQGGNNVEVKMTLTAPGCGMGEWLKTDVENKIRLVPGVTEVRAELVWDPPWNQGMISEAAKLELGLM